MGVIGIPRPPFAALWSLLADNVTSPLVVGIIMLYSSDVGTITNVLLAGFLVHSGRIPPATCSFPCRKGTIQSERNLQPSQNFVISRHLLYDPPLTWGFCGSAFPRILLGDQVRNRNLRGGLEPPY